MGKPVSMGQEPGPSLAGPLPPGSSQAAVKLSASAAVISKAYWDRRNLHLNSSTRLDQVSRDCWVLVLASVSFGVGLIVGCVCPYSMKAGNPQSK